MRRAAKVDESQPAIVAALRAAGCSVLILSGIGERAAPDLLVARNGRTWLLECKTPGRATEHKEHLAEQFEWRSSWKGTVAVVASVDDALRELRWAEGAMG
jgi:Holliday junction resolvase